MRLELTRRTDLALRAMRHLAGTGGRLCGADIASAIGASPQFLPQVMAPLVKVGWVGSDPGPLGGYHLISGSAISALDLIEVMEGPTDDGRCVLRSVPCPGLTTCALPDAWQQARSVLLTELSRTPILNPKARHLMTYPRGTFRLAVIAIALLTTIALACSEEAPAGSAGAGGASPAGAGVAYAPGDSILPDIVPVDRLAKAPPNESHLAYAPAVSPTIARTEPAIWAVHLESIEGVCDLDSGQRHQNRDVGFSGSE